jgi:hypothetical protein
LKYLDGDTFDETFIKVLSHRQKRIQGI